jgi:hypothetical protein
LDYYTTKETKYIASSLFSKMTYPATKPKMKHDLQCARPLPTEDSSLLSEMGFSNSTDLFRTLEEEVSATPNSLSSVYSYSDGPDYPGPLARGLLVLGVADLSLRYATVELVESRLGRLIGVN